MVGGLLSDHKGLNLPDVDVSAPPLTDKDVVDLRWALSLRADLIALSFVRAPEDVAAVHRVMDEVGVRLPVLAKVEKPQAARRLQDIVDAFDGIMVARGDLGVEMPLEQVPLVQKEAVRLAHVAYKGSGQAITDLVAGHVRMGSMTFTAALGQMQAKTIIPLAVSSERRMAGFAEVPTLKDLGYGELAVTTWFGFAAPAGLPRGARSRPRCCNSASIRVASGPPAAR